MHASTHQLAVCFLAFAAFYQPTCSNLARAQSVTWQILPFPDINWGGSQGQPATTNGNVITLHGQPVRTTQSFSGALRISYDVSFDARASSDGAVVLFIVPSGLSSNLMFPALQLYFGYRNVNGPDALFINDISADGDGTKVWGDVPFSLSAQTTYHHSIDAGENGELIWIVDDLTNVIPGSVKVPFDQFQIEMQSWQPGAATWSVSNFAVVPEPSAATLIAFGLTCMLLFLSGKKSRM